MDYCEYCSVLVDGNCPRTIGNLRMVTLGMTYLDINRYGGKFDGKSRNV